MDKSIERRVGRVSKSNPLGWIFCSVQEIADLIRGVSYKKTTPPNHPNQVTYQSEASQLVSDWMEFYNHRRSHSALDGKTPWAVYESEITLETAA